MAYSQMILNKYVSILEAMIFRIESENIIPRDRDYNCSLLMEMVKSSQTDLKYLAFSDFYILNKLYSLSDALDDFRALPRAIIARLTRSCAFDLDNTTITNECICVGTSEQDIIDEFSKNPLYKTFLEDYNRLKDKLGAELTKDNNEVTLFSYRFERYPLTKQIPFNEFTDKYIFSDMKLSRRFDFHYYRLGNGIPILDPHAKYLYLERDDCIPDVNLIPPLCVDSSLSTLKELRTMQFVVLRKYQVCD